jgi:putative ATPase
MYQPLADELRPRDLSEVYGQDHILGEGAILRRIIESGVVPNLIFYGPSGTGKTTVANIIAEKTNRRLFKLNATTASTADVKKIVSELDTMLTPNGVLLYLDEIQSFNKKQQQTLLEFIENGKITLIASTTENPYFYVFNAILSRSTIFEFKSLTPEACQQAVERAMRYMERKLNVTVRAEDGVSRFLATACGGDVRKAINAVEVLFTACAADDGVVHISLADADAPSISTASGISVSTGCCVVKLFKFFEATLPFVSTTSVPRGTHIFTISTASFINPPPLPRRSRIMPFIEGFSFFSATNASRTCLAASAVNSSSFI